MDETIMNNAREISDESILKNLNARDEDGIRRMQDKYEAYCSTIARNILLSEQDVEECVNDTWLAAWCSIPPEQPDSLGAYLAKITRNKAIAVIRRDKAKKRSAGGYDAAVSELEETLSDGRDDVSALIDQMVLSEAINRFLGDLDREKRLIFLERYFYMDTIREIAERHSCSEGRIKTLLLRLRRNLKQHLKLEDIQ